MTEYPDVPLWTPAVCAITMAAAYKYPVGWVCTLAYRREGWEADEWATDSYTSLSSEELADAVSEAVSSLLRV